MRNQTVWAICLLAILTTLPGASDGRRPAGHVKVNEDDVLYHIRKVLKREKRDERWNRAPELARMILEEANRYEIDPLVLTVIVQTESSFREGQIRGKVGEVGLTQIWGAAKKCDRTADLRTSRGQIRAGACWYAYALEKCKTERAALHAYQSGQCASNAYGPIPRSRILQRARSCIRSRQREIEELLNPEELLETESAYVDSTTNPPALTVRQQLTL